MKKIIPYFLAIPFFFLFPIIHILITYFKGPTTTISNYIIIESFIVGPSGLLTGIVLIYLITNSVSIKYRNKFRYIFLLVIPLYILFVVFAVLVMYLLQINPILATLLPLIPSIVFIIVMLSYGFLTKADYI